MEIDKKHLKFKHPFTCIVAGPTSSGKTILIRRILKHHKLLINIADESIRVMWCYGQWQDLYNELIPDNEIRYFPGLPSESEINDLKPQIIVIDDLMTELGNNKNLSNLFTKGSHHLNISVIFIAQNVFHQGTQMRTVSLNSHYALLMKNPRDKAQIKHLARQLYPENTKFLHEAYNDATEQPFGYLKIDLKQDTPNMLRVQAKITPEEHNEEIYKSTIACVIYTPK